MFIRAALGHFDHAPADFQVAVRIRRVLQRNRNAGIAADVVVLDPALRRIESHIFSVVIHPHGSHLRAAVLHQRSEISERLLLEQIQVLFWNHLSHLRPPRKIKRNSSPEFFPWRSAPPRSASALLPRSIRAPLPAKPSLPAARPSRQGPSRWYPRTPIPSAGRCTASRFLARPLSCCAPCR